MGEVEGAEVHGEGGEHKGDPFWDAVPLDHHVLLTYPAALDTDTNTDTDTDTDTVILQHLILLLLLLLLADCLCDHPAKLAAVYHHD